MKTFINVASLKLARLQAGQNVSTQGYYTAGDGGGATYLIVAPQAFDGYSNHELANSNIAVLQSDGAISIRVFGVTIDGSTDDSDAFEAAITSGLRLFGDDGTCVITRTMTTTSLLLDGRGMTFDATAITSASTYGIAVIGTAPTGITLTSNVDAGVSTFDVPDASVFTAGDWIALYDPTDSSWNPSRTAYRKGEYHYVIDTDTGADTVTITGNTFDSYTTAVAKIGIISSPAEVDISNFKLEFSKTTNAPILGLRLELVKNMSVDNIEVQGGQSPISVKRCFKGEISNTTGISYVSSVTSYGIIIGVSQDIDITFSKFHSDGNHGADIGGGDTVAGVVNRNIIYSNCTVTGEGFPASMHGNSEFCGYDGGFANGAIIAGDNNFIKNMSMVSKYDSIAVIRGTELLGTTHDISNNNIKFYDDSSIGSSIKFFDFSQSGIINADTLRGGELKITDNVFDYIGDRATATAFDMNNNGSSAIDISFLLTNNTINAAAGTTVTPYDSAIVSGAALDSLRYDGNMFNCTTTDYVTNAFSRVNEGLFDIGRFVIPALTYVTDNNVSIASGVSDTIYTRTGKTEILGGTVYANYVSLTIVVDGRTVLNTSAGGAVGASRGKDAAGNQYCVIHVPQIYALNSITITVNEEAGLTQNYGSTIYVKEY